MIDKSSLVVAYLTQRQETEGKSLVLHYFFRYVDRGNHVLRCLQTLLCQLIKGDDMPSEMDTLLDDKENPPERARVASYIEVLISIFKRADRPIFIVFDALDEVGDRYSYDALAAFLAKIQQECSPLQVRIFASSRSERYIMMSFHESVSATIVQIAAHQSDLSQMIEEELSGRFDKSTR